MGAMRPPRRNNTTLVIVAVIIVVAITVVIASVSYLWATDMCGDHGRNTPVATITVSKDPGGNYTLLISSIEPAADLDEVKYQLLNPNRVPVEQGDMDEIVNATLNTTTIIFLDNNNDSRMGTGDEIFLLSEENGGLAREGYIFRIIFDPTHKSIASVELT